MRARSLATLVLMLACLFVCPAQGQDADRLYTVVLRGVPMDQALEELARTAEIDLIYSSDLVADRTVYCDGRDLPAEPLLRCMLSGSGLDYVRSSTGTYVLIDSLKEQALYGDVVGRIVDRTTGEPLANANVLLADASAGTVTNGAGIFSFSSVITGPHRVVVTYVGYEPTVDSLTVEAHARNVVEIGLTPTTFSMDPIVIDGLTQRLPSQGLGRATLTGEDRTVRGDLGTPDVASAAAAVAGVSMRRPLADLHVQGGDAGEHLTTLDGVPVRDPVTLGRHLGAFSPLAIDRITVHKAGFGAAQGSHLTGVVALDHDVSPQGALSTALDVDPVSLTGKIQGRLPIRAAQQAAGMLSLRHSAWDVYRDPGLESLLEHWNAVDPVPAGVWIREPVTTGSLTARRHRPDLSFSDLHGAVRVDLGTFHTLDASVYRATNRIGSELAAVNAAGDDPADRLMLTLDDYDWTNWTAQARDTWLVGARSVATFQVLAGRHASRYHYMSTYGDVPPGTDVSEIDTHAAALQDVLHRSISSYENNEIDEIEAKGSVSHSFTPDRHLEVGAAVKHVDSQIRMGNHFVASITQATEAWHVGGYAEGRVGLGVQTTLEPGLRLTYLPERRSAYAEPRLALRVDGTNRHVGPYAVRLAGGLYRQFIPSFSLTSSGSTSVVPFIRFWLPVDHSFAPPRAYHLAAEALVSPWNQWSITVETYYKWEPYLLVLDYRALQRDFPAVRPRPAPVRIEQDQFLSPSSGRTYGASLRVRHAGPRTDLSMHYALVNAQRRFPGRFGDAQQPVPWSEPHRISASGRVKAFGALSLHVEGEVAWGRRWPLRRSYYDYLALAGGPESFPPFRLDRPAEGRLPAYRNLDVGATYDFSWDALHLLRLRVGVVNVLNHRNVYDRSLEPAPDGYASVDRTLPGRRPVFSLRLIY